MTFQLKPGDYIHADDFENEQQFNAVREEFRKAGATVLKGYGKWSDAGRNGNDCLAWYTNNMGNPLHGGLTGILWLHKNDHHCIRRIHPSDILSKPTLFEAAKNAPDGTRFMLKTMPGDVLVKRKTATNAWVLEWEDGASLSHSSLGMVDFDIVSLGPKKRDCDVTVLRLAGTLSAEVPDDMVDDCVGAFDLISRLCMWEGAKKPGTPGYVLSHIKNVDHSPIEPIYTKMILPYSVTFETAEQCLAAWKAECPEMFQ